MINLVTAEEYKLYLRQKFTDVEESNEKDIYYTNILIPGASKAIIQLLEQDFENKARIEAFTVIEEREFITISKRPLTSITKITINGEVQDVTSFYQRDDSIGIDGGTTINGLIQTRTRNGKIFWPLSYGKTVIEYVGGRTLERGDKWILCKAMAKLDQEDVRTFTGTDEAQGAIELEFESNRIFRQAFETYREYFL